jgi:hypothetical protein
MACIELHFVTCFKCLMTTHVACNTTDINLVVADGEYFPFTEAI